MSKYFIVLLFYLLLNSSVSAQSKEAYEIRVSGGAGHYLEPTRIYDYNEIGLNGNAGLEYALSTYISVLGLIEYYWFTIDDNEARPTIINDANGTIVAFTINVKVSPWKRSKKYSTYFLLGGGILNYSSNKGIESYPPSFDDHEYEIPSDFKEGKLISVGAGVERSINTKRIFFIEGKYSISFTPNSFHDLAEDYLKFVSLNFGLKFKI